MALGRFVKSFVIKAYCPVAELIDTFFAKKAFFREKSTGYCKVHKGTLRYINKYMPFLPACSSLVITEDLQASWLGWYMRIDFRQPLTTQSVR
jgi:hypothetical protein